MQNIEKTVLSQYAASPKINALINSFNEAVSIDDFTEKFLTLVWDINTAEGYGLDVWGKIVDVSRRLTVHTDFQHLGFSEALLESHTVNDPQPFGQAPFYSGEYLTETVELSDPIYRKLIMLKAMSNITDCTIPNINRMLVYMFGESGRAYVTSDGPLKMSYVFEFPLSTAELAIIQSSGALPSPPGVNVSIVQKGLYETDRQTGTD